MFSHHERLPERDGLLEFAVLTAAGKRDMRQQVGRAVLVAPCCGDSRSHLGKTNIPKGPASDTPGV